MDMSSAGTFFDKIKANSDNEPVAVSEYGAGASTYQHQWPLSDKKAGSHFHPEEWQSACHEDNWAIFSKRPYLWAKFIWAFADFQSSIRHEGDKDGINDKGLITYDRKVKKDAFYFYKANWNPAPMIYITSRRYVNRINKNVQVKVYSNLNEATLYINGIRISKKKKDVLNRILWNNVILSSGKNYIKIKGKSGNVALSDSCEWTVL